MKISVIILTLATAALTLTVEVQAQSSNGLGAPVSSAKLVCAKDSSSPVVSNKKIIFKYTDPKQFSPQFLSLFKIDPRDLSLVSKIQPFYADIDLPENESNALWGNRSALKIVNQISDDNPFFHSSWGADDGNTFKNLLSISYTNADGDQFGVYGSTDFYTKRQLKISDAQGHISIVSQPGVRDQYGTENDILAFFFNTENRGEILFFDAEAGYAVTQSQKEIFLGGQWEQNKFDQVLNNKVKHNTIPSGPDANHALYLKGFIGAQKDYFMGRACGIHIATQLGGSFDTGNGSRNYVLQNGSASFSYALNSGNTKPVSVGTTLGEHAQAGANSTVSADAGLNATYHNLTIINSVSRLIAGKGTSNGFTPNVISGPQAQILKQPWYEFTVIYKINNPFKKKN